MRENSFIFNSKILRATLFVVLGLIILGPICDLLVPSYFIEKNLPSRAFVRDSLEPSKDPIALLGDSVAHQLLFRHEGSFQVLTTQSISVAGQYLLLKNILETSPNVKKVVFAYIPHSFSNDLDQPYTFRDFVQTFLTTTNLEGHPDILLQKLFRKPEFVLGLFSIFKVNSFLQINYDPYSRVIFEPFIQYKPILSDISSVYLKMMWELCRARGVEIKLIPAPISEGANLDFSEFKARISKDNLGDIFEGYF